MKIALTTDSFVEGQGGVATAVAALARSLSFRRHTTMIYTAADPSHEKMDLDVVGMRGLSYERFPGGRAPLAPVDLVRKIAEFQPDAIHNHSMGTMGFQALAAAHLLGIPIIGTCHVLLAGFLRYAPLSIDGLPLTEKAAWLYTVALYNRFPQVTVPSDYMKGALQAHGLRVPLTTVSNGVDTRLFRPLTESPPDVDRPLTVIHVGRLGYEKRVSMLLRAFWLLLQNHPQSRLVIVGDGPEAGKLREEARGLGISDHVRFLGHISHDALPALYRSADVFATASNIETEGLVVLEAMACGLPVVGVDAAALPDAIQDGTTGFLTPPGDVPALAQALARLISAPELRERMGKASREQAEHHSLHFTAANYELLYQAVQDQTPRRLMPGMIDTPSINSILASLKSEGNAMAGEGVDKVWEVAEAVGAWTLASVIDPIRNGISGQQEKLDR